MSWIVTHRPFHADIALAISSPTFLGSYGQVQSELHCEVAPKAGDVNITPHQAQLLSNL
ncbi:hypothetical protein PISMIDRAFT_18450 [Pisolithus microcarpus 441]|uniref:Uncharacterized protein n=1 Tax=Pisolithus microcarpus 441 TaxID=765257 RepID=A0A0C9YY01_9AGAM|nr:hypothetical protein PISMIDRAFT_18450 [Pisolithus microcarpus 441]